MKKVVVTGASGFIGKNLIAHLSSMDDIECYGFDLGQDFSELEMQLRYTDFVFHLAGVNRPQQKDEYETGNKVFTEELLDILARYQRKVPFLFCSSVQATLDNPYGLSKRQAETAVFDWARNTGGESYVFRLPNVFGKWCRPNYNSVVATFCYNIAHRLPIQIHDQSSELTLVYIDEVVWEFIQTLQGSITKGTDGYCHIPRDFKITLGDLAERLYFFQDHRNTLVLPNFEDDFTRYLYATYLSYLPETEFDYAVEMKHDPRGWLTEIIKSRQFGQIFISTTKPGVTRGNHWHHTKVEKFIVVAGQALIRFRQIHGETVFEIPVDGKELKVVDIPAGYSHSIENIGDTDLITLFWADEIFNSNQPDTNFLEVLPLLCKN